MIFTFCLVRLLFDELLKLGQNYWWNNLMSYLASSRTYSTGIMDSDVTNFCRELLFLGAVMDPVAWATNDCGDAHLTPIE